MKGRMEAMENEKLRTLAEMEEIGEELKRNKRVLVFANGCFDILHAGHVRYLKAAKALGDALVVAVNSDRSARLLKGPGRPFTPQEERLEILAALECVDHLLLFDDPTVTELLRCLKPHIHAKGTDYTEEMVPEREMVLSYGGRIAITGDPKTRSSSEIGSRLKFSPGSEELPID